MTDCEKLLNLLDAMPSSRMAAAVGYLPDPEGYDFIRGVAEWGASNGATNPETSAYEIWEFEVRLGRMHERAAGITGVLGNQSGDGKYADDLRMITKSIRQAIDYMPDEPIDPKEVLRALQVV